MKTTLPFSIFARRWLVAAAVAGTVAAVAVFTTATGFAKGDYHDADALAEKMVEHLDNQLDLTRAQEEKITAILATSIEKRRQLMRHGHMPLQTLWQQDTLTADEIKAALEKHHNRQSSDKAARREQMTALRAQAMADIHAVLTPAQRQNSAAMIGGYFSGRHGKHHGGHGKHHGKHSKHHGKYGEHGKHSKQHGKHGCDHY